MIKNALSVLALSGLVLLSSCSKEEVEAKMNQAASAASDSLGDLKDMDFSSLSPEVLKEKAQSVAETLKAKLSEVKDEASAVDISKTAEPLVSALDKMKTALGDKMPDLESLSGIVDSLKAKFSDNEGIMNALRPLIEKLQSLLN